MRIKNDFYYTNPYFCPAFSGREKIFVMIKPDAFERHLDQKIMDTLKRNEMSITKIWEGFAPKEKLSEVYKQNADKSFFADWIDYLSKGKVRAMEIEGEDAIEKVLEIKKSIRAEYAPGERRINLMHCSDDAASAAREAGVFFDELA